MKKFHFALETVLTYQNQVLDALQEEHAVLLARVRRQEETVQALQDRYRANNEEYREKKQTGMTIIEALGYERGLQSLEAEITAETRVLEERRREAEQKRAEVVAAKMEVSSLDKLKERKLADYQKTVQKDEELLVEEFVSSARERVIHA